jgi:hypothetical protein
MCGCSPGLTYCQGGGGPGGGSQCANLQTSNQHCGMCGNSCPALGSCVAGKCTCPNGWTTCQGGGPGPGGGGMICVDLKSFPNHCGMCGNQCPQGQVCSNGACAASCAPGLAQCMGTRCVNLLSDPFNCGFCSVLCGGGTTCQNGDCKCPMGTTACGGYCVNILTSNSHCGGCNMACPQGRTCVNGKCQ